MSRPLPRPSIVPRRSHAAASPAQGDVDLALTSGQPRGDSPRLTTRRTLAMLYQRRALLDVEIADAEARLAEIRETYGRLPREHVPHGDESAYQRHLRRGVPFPEDAGQPPCGCRLAHAHYEQWRKERAEQRRQGVQLTIADAQEDSSGA